MVLHWTAINSLLPFDSLTAQHLLPFVPPAPQPTLHYLKSHLWCMSWCCTVLSPREPLKPQDSSAQMPDNVGMNGDSSYPT